MKIDIEKLNRIEIINHAGTSEFLPTGRCFSAHKIIGDFGSLAFDVQDGEQTLKIFLDK